MNNFIKSKRYVNNYVRKTMTIQITQKIDHSKGSMR